MPDARVQESSWKWSILSRGRAITDHAALDSFTDARVVNKKPPIVRLGSLLAPGTPALIRAPRKPVVIRLHRRTES